MASVKRTTTPFDPGDRARRIIIRLCQVGENVAKTQAPVDQNTLRDSINYDVEERGDVIVGTVGTNVEYAEAVEFGSEPHFPPIASLKGWANRVLGDEDAAYPVAKAIAKNGTKPQPFMSPAFERVVEVRETVAARTK